MRYSRCCTYFSIVKQTFGGDPASRPYRNYNKNDSKVRFYARASHNTQLTPLPFSLFLPSSYPPQCHIPLLVLRPFAGSCLLLLSLLLVLVLFRS